MTPQTAPETPKKTNGGAPPDARERAAELAALYPAGKSETIAGRSIEFKPCGLGQAARIIAAGYPLLELMEGLGLETIELLEQKPAEVADVIVAATELPAEWVRELPADDKLEIISAWLEVNRDFFFLRLVPKLERFGSAISGVGVGRTSFTS